ncbi:MAG TPA: Sir2 family NAD-dependent protein deacetylase [Treponemataceae bacterium]|nr:Sir2 family NAD-dependent protein deacetylase [Treponemataceae bacterium]
MQHLELSTSDILSAANHTTEQAMKKPIKNLVVITGAGVSAESGIQTFRDQDGIWERYPMDLIATPQGFL